MLKRFSIFVVAVVVLLIGCIVAQFVWGFFHHRYDNPSTGFYHGLVTASFDHLDEPFYSLRFRAQTAQRWYWQEPTNFIYSTVDLEWRDDSADRHATVSLPALTYQSDGVSGAFTRDVLTQWLRGSGDRVPDREQVDAIFGYFEAAAYGALPPPRHHTYHFEQPIRCSLQHFLLGYGVASTVYIWLAMWLFLVVFYAGRLPKRHRQG